MSKRPSLSLLQSLLFVAVMGIVLGLTVSASAEPILRLVTFTVADPSKPFKWPATPTDAFKALLEKLKPLTKGDFAAKTYQVHELKK